MSTGKLLFGKVIKNMFYISDKRNRGANILADFCRVHINMYKNLILCDQIRLTDCPVRNPCTYHNEKIWLIHSSIGICLTIITHHAKIHRILCLHNSKPHHGRHYRYLIFMRKIPQFLDSVTQMYATACTYDRSFGFFKLHNYFLDLNSMSFHRRLIGTQGNLFRIFESADCSILYINRNIYQDGTFSSWICYVKGLLKHTRDIFHPFYQIAVFYKGLYSARDICFLENITAYQFTFDLSGNAHHWNTVSKSRSNSCNQVRSTRAAGNCTYTHLTCDSRLSACCMGSVLFCSYKYWLYVWIENAVIKWADSYSRVSIYRCNALILQTFNHCVSADHNVHSYPFKFVMYIIIELFTLNYTYLTVLSKLHFLWLYCIFLTKCIIVQVAKVTIIC